MKILQINSVCGIRSTSQIMTDLHAILVSQEHQSTIAFGRHTTKNCDHTIRIGNRLNNHVYIVRTRLFDKHGFGSTGATKAFIDKINVLNPGVIHLRNLNGHYLYIGLLFEYLNMLINSLFGPYMIVGH